jgi:dihydroflavonol-4-reductase
MNFITGATGMLGTHLIAELLQRGLPVVAGCRSLENNQESLRLLKFKGFSEEQLKSIDWRICDVLDTDSLLAAFAGCSTVYHTAAIVSYHAKDRDLMYTTNVQGTANVVNVALEIGSIRLVHVSSIASLGKSNPGQVLDEKSEWENSPLNTHYGITKHLSDLEVWRGVQEGLTAVIIHPGFIIGPGSFERSSPSVFKKINEGMRYYPPGGTGFIGAADCAHRMVELDQRQVANESFVFVTRSESMQWLFSSIARSLNKEIPSTEAKPWILQLARIAEWLKELTTGQKALVTKETVKNASISFKYNTQKLLEAFPGSVDNLEKEIELAAAYFRATAQAN